MMNEDSTNPNGPSAWNAVDRNVSPEMLAQIGLPSLVYIREVRVGELDAELSSQINLPEDAILYAVHAANGERMAVLDDRNAAFFGARQHDLEPVSVH